ncbi:MAG: M23 family metallopeptidase [Candidatus Omnitrophica bacterium]|nr:M23 family metallopeptidase [Candidatus Omnitrophota bacterium]
MNKALFIFMMIVLIYASVSLHFVDKVQFLCPIDYRNQIIIRNDSRGDGFFGARRNGGRKHNGVDLYGEIGTPVKSVRSGRVIVADKLKNGLGTHVIIQHPRGATTIYAHLSEIYVKRGDFLQQGRVIGAVGKTGNATHPKIQPHLHFEVKKGGVPQDPIAYWE